MNTAVKWESGGGGWVQEWGRERGPSRAGYVGEIEGGQLVSVLPSIRPQRRHEENGGWCITGFCKPECACWGDRLGVRDEEENSKMRDRRKWTWRDRGLEGIGSSAHCLQLHLSSKPSSSCQDNCVSGLDPELAYSFKNILKRMCSVY